MMVVSEWVEDVSSSKSSSLLLGKEGVGIGVGT